MVSAHSRIRHTCPSTHTTHSNNHTHAAVFAYLSQFAGLLWQCGGLSFGDDTIRGACVACAHNTWAVLKLGTNNFILIFLEFFHVCIYIFLDGDLFFSFLHIFQHPARKNSPNLLVLLLDSVSMRQFAKRLPKTVEVFINTQQITPLKSGTVGSIFSHERDTKGVWLLYPY